MILSTADGVNCNKHGAPSLITIRFTEWRGASPDVSSWDEVAAHSWKRYSRSKTGAAALQCAARGLLE